MWNQQEKTKLLIKNLFQNVLIINTGVKQKN